MRLINSRKALNSLVVLLVAITFSACQGSKDVQPNPTPNPTPDPTPTPILTPVINWVVSGNDVHRTDKAFVGEIKNLSISVQYADSSRIMGTHASSVQTGVITSPVAYTAIAWYDKGNNVTNPKGLTVYSADTSFLCWNTVTQQYAKWTNTTAMQTLDGGVHWFPLTLDLVKWIYYPDGSRQGITSGIFDSNYQISVVGTDMYINLGKVGSPPNKYKVESLNNTTLVLSKLENGTLSVVTYTKS